MDGLRGEESAEVVLVAWNEPGVAADGIPVQRRCPEVSLAIKDRT